MAEQTVYYFDGSGGCDICAAASGYYPEIPEPHIMCQCSYEEIIVSDGSNITIEYRGASFEESRASSGEVAEYDNCGNRSDATVSPVISEDEEGEIDAELAQAADWEEPESDLDTDVVVDAESRGTITVVMERYFVVVKAEVWMSEDGAPPEHVGDIEDHFSKNVSIERVEIFVEDEHCFPERIPM